MYCYYCAVNYTYIEKYLKRGDIECMKTKTTHKIKWVYNTNAETVDKKYNIYCFCTVHNYTENTQKG